jgi:hypothetical protein
MTVTQLLTAHPGILAAVIAALIIALLILVIKVESASIVKKGKEYKVGFKFGWPPGRKSRIPKQSARS